MQSNDFIISIAGHYDSNVQMKQKKLRRTEDTKRKHLLQSFTRQALKNLHVLYSELLNAMNEKDAASVGCGFMTSKWSFIFDSQKWCVWLTACIQRGFFPPENAFKHTHTWAKHFPNSVRNLLVGEGFHSWLENARLSNDIVLRKFSP